MTVRVVMNARANAGTGNEVATFLQSIMPEARAYAGCTSAIAYQSRDDTDDVVVLETWASREHYRKYIEWRREEGVSARFKEMLDGEPRVGFIEEAEI